MNAFDSCAISGLVAMDTTCIVLAEYALENGVLFPGRRATFDSLPTVYGTHQRFHPTVWYSR